MPLKKKITPQESSFKYNPKVGEICFISDLKFYLNKDLKFQLDQNPHGVPVLSEITDIESNEDYSIISFNSNFRNENIKFIINSKYKCDNFILKTIKLVNDNKIKPTFNNDDLDKVEISFRKGKLLSIYIYKYKNYNLIDSLTIINENNELYLIKQNPWKKEKLKTINMINNKFIYEIETGSFSFSLDVNDFILKIINNLID